MSEPAIALAPAVEKVDWLTPIELLLLGAVWGASFMFMRVAAPEFGTVPLVEMRLSLGAAVLLPFLIRAWHKMPRGRWPMLALIGTINSAIPFALFAWAAQHAPAGVGAISNAMTVLFTALVAVAFFDEKIGLRRGSALVVGFIGIIVLASSKIAGASVTEAVIAGTLASLSYGVGANLVRKFLTGMPTTAIAAATLSCAALITLPFAIAYWPEQPISARAWGSAAMLGAVCTGLAFALFYRLINRVGASRAVTVTYLIPVFGVLWAWWLLDEPLTISMAVAGVLIVGSVAISQRR